MKTSPSKLMAPMRRVANPAQEKFFMSQIKIMQKWSKMKYNSYLAEQTKLVKKGKLKSKNFDKLRIKYGLKPIPRKFM